MPRGQIDWEAVERDYRAGCLSVREIARKHGCDDKAVRRRAVELQWIRDLADKVRQRAAAKVRTSAQKSAPAQEGMPADALRKDEESPHLSARKSAPPSRARGCGHRRPSARPSDEEVVEAAAEEMAAIIQQHRESLERLREVTNLLDRDLRVETTTVLTRKGETAVVPVDLETRSRGTVAYARATEIRLAAERRAYGLDDDKKPGEDADKPLYVVALPTPSPTVEAWTDANASK